MREKRLPIPLSLFFLVLALVCLLGSDRSHSRVRIDEADRVPMAGILHPLARAEYGTVVLTPSLGSTIRNRMTRGAPRTPADWPTALDSKAHKAIGKGYARSVANVRNPSMFASAPVANKFTAGRSETQLSSLPAAAQGPISAALGKDDSKYWVHRSAAGFRWENSRKALVAEFTRQGAEVRSHNLRWRLETRGYGYGDALHSLKAVAPQADANRVEYRRDGVTEWYENGPLGLEQGFTLAHPPGRANGQALTVELALNGDLVTAVDAGGKALEMRHKDGEAALRYTGLNARDAMGRELRTWLEVGGERLLVRVDDGRARYPIVVDPWVQQAELTASDGAPLDGFGSVAVSGSTLVVGASSKIVGLHNQQGAAYIFVKSAGTWSQQAELTASDGAASDQFGSSVAVSGNTLVVGAPWHTTVGPNQYQGAAYVFVESGGTWTQQAELTASDGAGSDNFGYSVAVSGSTAVVGAPNHTTAGLNLKQGAAYAFVESGGTWTQQAELTASDGAAFDSFGISVAVTGSTAVVGVPYRTVGSNIGQGVAYVFVESAGTWSQQAELTESDGAGNDWFGYSVAVNGSTAVVGSPSFNVGSEAYAGKAYVFVESAGTWSQQAKLTASDGAISDRFGNSVAVSGSTAVLGAPFHQVGSNTRQGAAYVFVESGGTWTQQAELTASDGAAGDYLGVSVALDGSTGVVGAPVHTVGSNAGQGAAYVFATTAVTLSPVSLSFSGEVLGTTSSAQAVTLNNASTASLIINSISITGSNVGDFAQTNNCGTSVAAGGSCTVNVTFTPIAVGTRSASVSVSDNLSGSPQTVPLSGTGVSPDFGLQESAFNPTPVVAGQSASSTITVTSKNGFNSAVSLTCSIAPTPSLAPSCGFSAGSVTPAANGAATSTLTISTTAATATKAFAKRGEGRGWFYGLWLPLPAIVLLGAGLSKGSRKPRWPGLLLGLVLAAGVAFHLGCGGSSSTRGGGGNPGTPAGSYTITLTANSASITHMMTVTLTVQ